MLSFNGKWKIKKIGEIAAMKSGGTPPTSNKNYYNGHIPWVTIADMSKVNKFIYSTQKNISTAGLDNSTAQVYPAGVVLYAMYASIGECSIAGTSLSSHQAILAITPKKDLHNEFLFYYLTLIKNYAKSMAQHGTQGNLNKKLVSEINILLPDDVKEQSAIAAVLSDADELIEKLEQLIAKKHDIKQGVMQQLLTGKKRLSGFSGEWKVKNLGEFSDVIKGAGLSKSQITNHGKYPCILYGELYTLYDRLISDVISKTNVQGGRLSISGDILMPGSTTTLGIDLATASALLVDNVFLGGDINIIRIRDNSYNSVFLANYLTFFKEEIAKIAQGTTVHHLYGRDLKNILIKSPSHKEQTAIATVLSNMDAEIVALEKSLKKHCQIKIGMMQQLLTGKIRLTNQQQKRV